MPNINITEVTGTSQVVGPDITQNFLVSGNDYGDSILVNATQSPLSVNISVAASPQAISVSGQSSGDSIGITIIEAIYPTGSGISGPYSTRFYYSGDGKLIQKSYANTNIYFNYNVDNSLNQVIYPTYTKTMLYNPGGALTGFDVS